MNNKPTCHPEKPESGQQEMTPNDLIGIACDIEREALRLHLYAKSFVFNIKNGFYGGALLDATNLKLDKNHPEIYQAIKAKA